MTTIIDKELDRLNAKLNVRYPEIGYSYYSNVKGDGYNYKRYIYTITNAEGGVVYSPLNGRHARETISNIRAKIESLTAEGKQS